MNKKHHITPQPNTLQFAVILILIIANTISLALTIKLVSSFASTGSDAVINIATGSVLAFAQIVFTAMLVFFYLTGRPFLSVIIFIMMIPLSIVSISSSWLQLLNSISKTDQRALKDDQAYKFLLEERDKYLSEISKLESHPFYNEKNPINKSRIDREIREINIQVNEINRKIIHFSSTNTEYSEGFRLVSNWLGMTTDEFKRAASMSLSILLDAISWICTIFLVISTEYSRGYKPKIAGSSPNPDGSSPPSPKRRLSDKITGVVKSSVATATTPRATSHTATANIQEEYSNDNLSPEYSTPISDNPLIVQLGINKETKTPIITNIRDFPHVVIAGFTGSGKSSLIKAIITQLIQRSPSEVKILPIDLKQGSTFIRFKDVSHLERPLASNNQQAIQHLDYLIEETQKRQEFLTKHDCEDIEEYESEHDGVRPFHYLVAIFEEIAALMQEDKKAAEKLSKITSTARSAGVHCILCTQYPKDNVLSSSITTNCPVKICFSLDKAEQSRVVLGDNGAEKLQGKGHALLKVDRKLVNIKTIFYEKDKIKKIVSNSIAEYGRNILEPVKPNIPLPDPRPAQQNIIPFPNNNNIQPQGELSSSSSLIEQAKALREQGLKQVEIGQRLGLNQGTVSKMLRR